MRDANMPMDPWISEDESWIHPSNAHLTGEVAEDHLNVNPKSEERPSAPDGRRAVGRGSVSANTQQDVIGAVRNLGLSRNQYDPWSTIGTRVAEEVFFNDDKQNHAQQVEDTENAVQIVEEDIAEVTEQKSHRFIRIFHIKKEEQARVSMHGRKLSLDHSFVDLHLQREGAPPPNSPRTMSVDRVVFENAEGYSAKYFKRTNTENLPQTFEVAVADWVSDSDVRTQSDFKISGRFSYSQVVSSEPRPSPKGRFRIMRRLRAHISRTFRFC